MGITTLQVASRVWVMRASDLEAWKKDTEFLGRLANFASSIAGSGGSHLEEQTKG